MAAPTIPAREEAPHLYADYVLNQFQACWACHLLCQWGYTTKGKRSLFDRETGVNHWITCPRREAVRRWAKRTKERSRR